MKYLYRIVPNFNHKNRKRQLKSNELLSYLSDLELKLNSFSFEELTSLEATRLKKSFQIFKQNLERKTTTKIVDVENTRPKRKTISSIQTKQKSLNSYDQELLIAKVSHEIRTPLNGIIGFTELLADDELTEKQMAHVNAIQSASNSLLTIVNELLEYSKLSSGSSYFENVEFNFSSLIKDVGYLFETLIINPDVSLNISISKDIPTILVGDPSKLSQILLNLVGNAIKFVDKGSIDVRITTISLDDKSVVVNFKIQDTGIGIAEENLKNIFDYYKQAEVDTHKNYGGTGLGLSIVKHIVVHLNGTITVTSKINVGTTFNVTLPFAIGNASDKQGVIALNTDLKAQEEAIKNMSFLVFEDNTMNQKLIQNRLDFWGCKNYVTDTIAFGMAILEKEKIDVILMDLRMPEISGFEVAKIIRKNPNVKINSIPIIALTADFTVKDKSRCEESGINDYILKPFDSKELLKKLTSNITNLKAIKNMNNSSVISEASAIEPSEIDLSSLLEDCFGEVEMLEELVQLFKLNTIEFIGKTKVDIKAANAEGVKFNAHKIKSGLKMMRIPSLLRIVEQMHKVCLDDQDFKYLSFLYDCFLKEYPLIETEINKAIIAYKNNQKL